MRPSKQSRQYSKSLKNHFYRLIYMVFPSKRRLERLILKGYEYRPHYAYNILKSFQEAERLNYSSFTIIEFGCAGGSGLIDIEYHVKRISRYYKISTKVFGFDAGDGLPPSNDYRDVLYLWKHGDYKMNYDLLQKNLNISKIILGDVKETLPKFFREEEIPPIGLIFQDMDYYTSTFNSLIEFSKLPEKILFPRVRCYFDDTLYTSMYLGELLAIEEFNKINVNRKISLIELEAEFLSINWRKWIYLGKKFYYLHSFNHIDYNKNEISKNLDIT